MFKVRVGVERAIAGGKDQAADPLTRRHVPLGRRPLGHRSNPWGVLHASIVGAARTSMVLQTGAGTADTVTASSASTPDRAGAEPTPTGRPPVARGPVARRSPALMSLGPVDGVIPPID